LAESIKTKNSNSTVGVLKSMGDEKVELFVLNTPFYLFNLKVPKLSSTVLLHLEI